MVVLPGYGAGSCFYFRNIDGLAQHFRLHCVDLLGTGMSGGNHLLTVLTTSLPALVTMCDSSGFGTRSFLFPLAQKCG